MSYAPDTLPRGYDWRDDGECRRPEYDPEQWHPTGTTGPHLAQIADAKTVCYGCPVMRECRQWALTHRTESGIWGGMTENERVAWHRRMVRANAKAAAAPVPTVHRTLQDAYAALTGPVDEGGHVDWIGGRSNSVRGTCYSPNRLTWAVTRGTPPVGSVVRYCDRAQCVAHIEDRVEREARKAAEQPAAA